MKLAVLLKTTHPFRNQHQIAILSLSNSDVLGSRFATFYTPIISHIVKKEKTFV